MLRFTALRSARLGVAALALFALAAGLAYAADEITFAIPAGKHGDAGGLGLRKPQFKRHVDRTLTFKARFTDSAAYVTALPSNQGDWNKLMGISTNRIHRNSIRLGWRWLPGESLMQLGFYGYIKGERISAALTKVPLNEWVDVSLRLHNDGLTATAGGVSYIKLAGLGLSRVIPTMTWVLQTAYFGGDETAPHGIAVQVKDVAVH